jgi:DNA-binding LytR/AlgR family response regulator
MKAIIAEDEALLRDELVAQLARAWPELEIAAVCGDGAEALEAIEAHAPEVAFLDIRMPGLTGLEVAAAAAETSPRTQVVFVTAYNQYALDAFDRGAIDYLLKPLQRDRLEATVRRVKQRIDAGTSASGELAGILEQLRARLPNVAKREPFAWINASVGKETRLILVEDVIYFRSDEKYTAVVTAEGEALIRKPIRELLDVLDPNVFKQVHRSTIVNLAAVAGISRDATGRGTMRLKNRPETLPVSLTFMPLFRNM